MSREMTNSEAISNLNHIYGMVSPNIQRSLDVAFKAMKRQKGEWIKVTKAGTVPVEYICSLCRRKIYDNYELTTPIDEFYPFCHCGADMRKGGAE